MDFCVMCMSSCNDCCHQDVPPECRAEQMNWWQSIAATLRSLKSLVLWSDDVCDKYQYILHVSPWTEANPLRVLAHTTLLLRQNSESVAIGILELDTREMEELYVISVTQFV